MIKMESSRDTSGLIQHDGLEAANSERVPQTYTLYKWRWYILLVVCLLNFSNALLWLTFSPVADFAADFYSVTTDDINYLSLVFMIASVPVGMTATWVLDTYGLRFGILLGAWVNVTGSVIRVISCAPFLPVHYRFAVAMTGQTIAACSQPYIMFLPTKMAALWFSDDQRAVANTIASMSNPLGIMIANVISPVVVTESKDIYLLNLLTMSPAILAVLTSSLGVWASTPPSPPSPSAEATSEPFLAGIKQVMKNKAFLILSLCLGGGIGLFSALQTVLEQIVCARGYSDEFAGICGILLIVFGIIGAAVAGVIVDKTKKFEEVAKTCFGVAAFAAIFFAIISQHRDQDIAIAASCALFGLFGFAVYPIGLELGVECTYPVAEATSAGIIIMAGQIQGIVYVLLLTEVLVQPLSTFDYKFQTCTVTDSPPPLGNLTDLGSWLGDGTDVTTTLAATTTANSNITPYDMTVANLVFAGLTTAVACIFITFFRTDYKRLMAERLKQTSRILNFT